MEKHTRLWRLMVILLVALSMLLLLLMTWVERQPLSFLRQLHGGWRSDSIQESSPPVQQIPPVVSALNALFTLSVAGVATLYLFPGPIRRLQRALSTSFAGLLRLSTLGFVAMLLALVVSVSAAFSISVFPLTIVLATLLILTSYLGIVAMGYSLGRDLLQRAGWPHLSPVYALLLGVFVLFPLAELPYIGLVFKILFASLGSGAVIATRFGSGKLWTLEPLLEEDLS